MVDDRSCILYYKYCLVNVTNFEFIKDINSFRPIFIQVGICEFIYSQIPNTQLQIINHKSLQFATFVVLWSATNVFGRKYRMGS